MLSGSIERDGMKQISGVCGLASAILLGGCSVFSQFTTHQPNYGNQASWSKQGVSSQETATALSACNGQARAATDRDTNITTDIMAARPNNWSNTAGPVGTQNQYVSAGRGQLFENQDRDLNASIVNQCMISKGFTPGD
jgi:hypothetical protein